MIYFKFFILGALTSLLYPPFFMLPLGFILFPYFIFLISKVSYQKSFFKLFFCGSLYGFGFLLVYLSWIYNPFLVYETTKPYAILALLLPIFISLFFGLGFIFYRFYNEPFFLTIITPFIFTLIEFSISNFFYGFPWISNSLILSNNIFGFYLVKYLGTISSGHLVISIFILTSFFFYNFKIKNYYKYSIIAYSPFFLILIIPIIYLFSNNNDKISKEITIDIHQILSPIDKKDKNKIEENIINLVNDSNADYVVFAENNLPFLIDKKNLFKLNKLINKEKKVIIGATTIEDRKYYNSFLLIENNQILFFDKQILVPFGEFLPLRKYLNFMETISGNVDFSNGVSKRIITTKDKLNILPVICYEIIFDGVFKDINEKEIDILINITNDSWFGNKIGPYQHFYIARLKSLITNKPLIRVSNNGISAIIDHDGKIIKSSKLNIKSQLTYKLNFEKNISYLYLHKLISYFLLFIFILFLIFNNKYIKKNEF